MSEAVAIVGSRVAGALLDECIEFVKALPNGTTVVTGGASGVDACAEGTARARGLNVVVIPADWDRHGRRAGAVRNAEIVKRADRVVAFWNGQSPGTKITIDIARREGKPVEVITPDTNRRQREA